MAEPGSLGASDGENQANEARIKELIHGLGADIDIGREYDDVRRGMVLLE